VRPWLRRARTHEDLLGLNGLIPGFRVEILPTSTSTVTVSLEIGEVRILIARAISPNMMIPKSAYRCAIATHSLQRSLFGDEPSEPDAKLYGVILHGGDRGGPAPSFIMVRFPTADHEMYLDTKIDLLSEFSIAKSQSTQVEQVIARHSLTLKPGLQKGSDSA
jgi:hypothetical protein